MGKYWIFIGALFALLSVATGAFGAHALATRLEPRAVEIWQTASHYQMYHALGLIAVGILYWFMPAVSLNVAGWCFTLGVILFSGSLYTLSFTGIKKLGMITPFGGMLFLVGWGALLVWAWKASLDRTT